MIFKSTNFISLIKEMKYNNNYFLIFCYFIYDAIFVIDTYEAISKNR